MGGATALSQQPGPPQVDPNLRVGCPYHGMGYGGPHGMMGWGMGPYHGYGHMHPGMGYGMGRRDHMGRGYEGRGPGYPMGEGYGMGPRYGMGRGFHRMPLIDSDENGTVSAAEAASHAEEVFLAMDADEDGDLTLDEFASVHFGPQSRGEEGVRPRRQQRKAERFAEMNADGDDTLTREEFMAWHEARFEAADDDGDGNVTPWEFRSRRRF
jgi:hypothetical protein